MALGGDLRNINLGDIFQTLSMNRQAGTLVVRSGSEEKRILFTPEGICLLSGRTITGFRLGRYLAGIGRITPKDLDIALGEQRVNGGRLGEVLVRLGLCRPEDVQEALRYQAAEELYDLFTWTEGEFEFLEGPPPPDTPPPSQYAACVFDAGAVVMEAARRIDEWDRIREFIPDFGEYYVPSGLAGPELDPAGGREEAAVYAAVDGTRSIEEILDEHHLSRFDTATILKELVERRFIQPADFTELTRIAWQLIDKKEIETAVRVLERAHVKDPRDIATIEQLVMCYEKIDEKRAAARALAALGEILIAEGRTGEAVNALQKAEKFDPGSERPVILLMQAYLAVGDRETAAEKASGAARLLRERGQHREAVEVCRQGLASYPEHVGLRIEIANAYLALGDRDLAIQELEEVAAACEEQRDYRRLPEIYRQILRLDASRSEYLRRLQELKQGEARRRRRLVRAGALGGAGLALLVLVLLVFSSGTGAEEKLARARELLGGGRYAEAQALAREVAGEDPDSDLAIQARNILFEIQRKRSGGDTKVRQATAKLEDAIEGFLSPAANDFAAERFGKGTERLLELVDYLKSPECESLASRIGKAAWTRMRTDYRKGVLGLLRNYGEWLEKVNADAQGRLEDLRIEKLHRLDRPALEAAVKTAGEVRRLAGAEGRRKVVAAAEAIELSLAGGKKKVCERLYSLSSSLDHIYEKADAYYHSARALLLKARLQSSFLESRQRISDLLNRGELVKARDACREFLARCRELTREEPRSYYQPVAEEVLGEEGLDLDAKMEALLAGIREVMGGLERGEDLVRRERYEQANEVFRSLIAEHYRIDFRNLVRLCLLLKTRPEGARVTIRTGSTPARDLGRTPPAGLLLRYPPYGVTTVEIEKETFTPHRFRINGYEDAHAARMLVSLEKEPCWTVREGGPVQTSPVPTEDHLVVASRDGRVLVHRVSDGKLDAQYDSGLISGFAASPEIRDGVATLCALDGRVLALDLSTMHPLSTFTTGAPLRSAPLLVGDLTVVSDDQGTVYGLKGAKEVWRRSLAGRVQGDGVALQDGVILATTEGRVVRLAAADGRPVWERAVGGPVYASLLRAGNRVLVGTESSELVALDVESGAVRWRFSAGNAVRGRPALLEDEVLIGTLGGNLYRLGLEDGIRRGKLPLPTGTRLESGVVAGDRRFYAVGSDHLLYAFDREHGLAWTFQLGADTTAAPVYRDGRLFVVTDGGRLICFLD